MKSQGLPDHQQVVFLSDGGEDVRRVQTYLHPDSEHWIDWFHITMRITVLQQQSQSMQGEASVDAEGRAPIAAGPNQGVEQRIGGCLPTMVSAVSHRGKGGARQIWGNHATARSRR